jgi:hypothetical protein
MIRIGPAAIAALGALVFVACPALLLPSAARANCLYFDVGPDWALHQSNGARVIFQLRQTEGEFQGPVTFDIPGVTSDHHGSADGVISGESIRFTIRWDDGAVGDYTGAIKDYIDSDDRHGLPRRIELEGTTVDKTNGASQATWHALLTYRCLNDDGITPHTSLNFGLPAPTVVLGRTPAPAGAPVRPPMSMCKRAAEARARNSPGAADLEARCAVTTAPVKRD